MLWFKITHFSKTGGDSGSWHSWRCGTKVVEKAVEQCSTLTPSFYLTPKVQQKCSQKNAHAELLFYLLNGKNIL